MSCVQLAFQTGYVSIKSSELVGNEYNVVLGPPNNEVAKYLRNEYMRISDFNARGAYVNALFLGNFGKACAELQRTLRALSADMVPHNGTAVRDNAAIGHCHSDR